MTGLISLKSKGLSVLPCPPDLPNPGIKPGSPALQVDSLPTELPGKPSEGTQEMERNQLKEETYRSFFCSVDQASLVAQLVENLPAMQETQL